MKKSFVLVLLLVCFCSVSSYAQQDPLLGQYMFNQLTFNPAYSGVEGYTKMSVIHRTQWLGQTNSFDPTRGNPETQFLTLDVPLLKFRSGVGLTLINDNLGPLNNVQIKGSFAYHLALNNKSKLSFGMSFGAFAQSINEKKYLAIHQEEFDNGGFGSQIRPDLGFGVHYQAEKYYVGLSATHLLEQEFDWGSITKIRNARQQHLYLTAGYNYEVNYNFIVTPTVLLRSDLNQYSFDFGAIGTYDEKIWGGAQFRQGEAAVILMGYKFLKDQAMSIGYAFDYIIKGSDAKAATSHELMLSYRFPPVINSNKKQIRSPRFRHSTGVVGAGN